MSCRFCKAARKVLLKAKVNLIHLIPCSQKPPQSGHKNAAKITPALETSAALSYTLGHIVRVHLENILQLTKGSKIVIFVKTTLIKIKYNVIVAIILAKIKTISIFSEAITI